MAISLNAISSAPVLGGRLTLGPLLNPSIPSLTPPAPAPAPTTVAPPFFPGLNLGLFPPAPAPAAPSPAAPPLSTIFNPGTIGIGISRPPIMLPPTFIPPTVVQPSPAPSQTTTQLANGAIAQLNNLATGTVTQAINSIKSKSLDGVGLIPYLERKVRIGEVLNDLAKDWSATTRSDFADAFSLDPNNFNNDVADAIVSIAILNDKDLEAEITAENTPQTTPGDLTDNRRIVWQSVAPGTPLNPPYVILVAVEYQDVAKAADFLKAITDQLGTTVSGLRLPKAAIQKGAN